MRGLLWAGFGARGANDVADAGELGGEDLMVECGDAIVAPSVVGEALLFDEVVADHPRG